MLKFLKTTIFGGIIFLVPVIILIAIIGKALAVIGKITAPFAKALPFGPVGDAVVVNIVGITIIVLICFLGGLIAKSAIVAELVGSIEEKFLSKIPVYSLVKGAVSSSLQGGEAEGMKPVLVRFDDSWQIAFEVEKLTDDKVAIFLPGAPDPWSGSVCFVTEDRVTKLDANLMSVKNIMEGFGKGAGSELRGY